MLQHDVRQWLGASSELVGIGASCLRLIGVLPRSERGSAFIDRASMRGKLEALAVFRGHNVPVVAYPPHLAHVLQPVDAAWARSVKSDCVVRYRFWGQGERQAELAVKLSRPLGTSATMLGGEELWQRPSSWRGMLRGGPTGGLEVVTGLTDSRGVFCRARSLARCYLEDRPWDRARTSAPMFITSDLLTCDAWMLAARARDMARARGPPRGRAGGASRQVAAVDDKPHRDRFTVVDHGVFDAFAAVSMVACDRRSWGMGGRIMVTGRPIGIARREGWIEARARSHRGVGFPRMWGSGG
jgi:hypothetical protein